MPQIGWFEILVIVVIAILVIGPKDFPFVLRKMGNWINLAKTYVANFTSNIDEIANSSIIDEDSVDKKISKKSSTKDDNENSG
mgnify:FL=1|tara:strand:+ start:207 stop:455 length:249 start_codon:yes stop_codon:yes gene_type:complete